MKKLLLILLCGVLFLSGCVDDLDIEPTEPTRDPKEEAELRKILDESMLEAMTLPTTTSFEEGYAVIDFENNMSELVKLNLVAENLTISNDNIAQFYFDDLIAFKDRSKFGFINIYGDEIIPAVYSSFFKDSEGLMTVQNDRNKWGYISKDGTVVISFQYDRAGRFKGGLAPAGIFDGRKMGYINTSGEIVIPLVYDETFEFYDGYAVLRQGQKLGIIDTAGNITVPFEYDYIFEVPSNGVYIAANRIDGELKYGAIDAKNNIIKQFEYNDSANILNDNINYFSEGLTAISDGEQVYYFNETGEIIIEVETDLSKIVGGGPFINGVASVYIEMQGNSTGYAYGLIDVAGKFVLPCVYNFISQLGENYIAVQRYRNGTWNIYEMEV